MIDKSSLNMFSQGLHILAFSKLFFVLKLFNSYKKSFYFKNAANFVLDCFAIGSNFSDVCNCMIMLLNKTIYKRCNDILAFSKNWNRIVYGNFYCCNKYFETKIFVIYFFFLFKQSILNKMIMKLLIKGSGRNNKIFFI